jgi:hypothetical protein
MLDAYDRCSMSFCCFVHLRSFALVFIMMNHCSLVLLSIEWKLLKVISLVQIGADYINQMITIAKLSVIIWDLVYLIA